MNRDVHPTETGVHRGADFSRRECGFSRCHSRHGERLLTEEQAALFALVFEAWDLGDDETERLAVARLHALALDGDAGTLIPAHDPPAALATFLPTLPLSPNDFDVQGGG